MDGGKGTPPVIGFRYRPYEIIQFLVEMIQKSAFHLGIIAQNFGFNYS